VHYCPVLLKDRVQMGERFKRRAKNVAAAYDHVTEEGMLLRGAVYLQKPGVGYRKRIGKKNLMPRLKKIRKQLMQRYKIPAKLIEVDEMKQRLLTTGQVVEELSEHLKKEKLVPAIVEEDPTYYNLEIEVIFL